MFSMFGRDDGDRLCHSEEVVGGYAAPSWVRECPTLNSGGGGGGLEREGMNE